MDIELAVTSSARASVSIAPKKLGCHTAVLAQSGAGKSFMVGRLLEELLLKTKARLLILDPNSDFVRLGDPDPKSWSEPGLQPWFFPGESEGDFVKRWAGVTVTVLTQRNLPGARVPRISWGDLSLDEQASIMDIDPLTDALVYSLLALATAVARERWDDSSEPQHDFSFFRDVAYEVCDFLVSGTAADDIADDQLAQSLRALGAAPALKFRAVVYSLDDLDIWRSIGDGEPDIADYLRGQPTSPQAFVVDLLSLNSEVERTALVGRLLSSIWSEARSQYAQALRDAEQPDVRAPTIIVIDEAHNVVPAVRASSAMERIAADVVRIAAEGRKFGLELLVVTQRPRKIDSNVLSECDNLLLMRMTNEKDVEFAQDVFGFISKWAAAEAGKLKTGEVLLQGRVAVGDEVCHVSPRRTRQGGRSLDDDYWTNPW